jgi:hypothetical protein
MIAATFVVLVDGNARQPDFDRDVPEVVDESVIGRVTMMGFKFETHLQSHPPSVVLNIALKQTPQRLQN